MNIFKGRVMQFEINSVYTLKLMSGEELVVKVVDSDADTITVSGPVSVAPGPQGMNLIPSLFTADHDNPITINKSSIVMQALTDEPVRVKYIEATTGIRVPEKKILMS